MKSHLQLISTKGMSYADWITHRQMGIGASEIQYIMGLNNPKYGSNLELHLSKSGQWDKISEDSFHTYKGRVTEANIVNDYWKYFTDSPESVLTNYANPEYIKKKCRKLNAFIINPKYPWLFGSIDRELPNGHISRLTGEVLVSGGILEAKNTRNQEASHYEANIAPNFLGQTQCYMTITEKKYSELQILLDSTYPQLYAFERSEIFIEEMLDRTKLFWDNVIKSKQLVTLKKEAESRGDFSGHAQIDYELLQLEPPIQSTEGYNQFLKEKYRDMEVGRVSLGTDEQLGWVKGLLEIQGKIKALEVEEILLKNKIQKSMGEMESETLDFGDEGKVNWKSDINKIKRFSIKLKTI